MNQLTQMDFSFIAEDRKRNEDEQRQKRISDHIAAWGYCWGWSGPEVGQPCEIHNCVVKLADPAGSVTGNIYAYMERCILLEHLPDGAWLAEIAMGEVWGKPWAKDGTRVILEVTDIWPPTRDIREQRKKT